MSENNALNRFERDGQPTSDLDDNKLILGGSVESEGGVSLKSARVAVQMDDISTAGSVWISLGEACTVTKITSIINGAITGADAAITTEIGGTPVTTGALTIANVGSAAGIVDTASPTALNVLTATEGLEIITDGASTGTVAAVFVVEFDIS